MDVFPVRGGNNNTDLAAPNATFTTDLPPLVHVPWTTEAPPTPAPKPTPAPTPSGNTTIGQADINKSSSNGNKTSIQPFNSSSTDSSDEKLSHNIEVTGIGFSSSGIQNVLVRPESVNNQSTSDSKNKNLSLQIEREITGIAFSKELNTSSKRP